MDNTNEQYRADEETAKVRDARVTARVIGEEIASRWAPPSLDAGRRYLAVFSRWDDVVDVLGGEVAFAEAREGFRQARTPWDGDEG